MNILNLKKAGIIAGLSLVLAACSNDKGGGSGAQTGSAANMKTFSEAELTSDLAAVNKNEESMEESGLRIKESFDSTNGLTTRTWTFDKDFRDRWIRALPISPGADVAAVSKDIALKQSSKMKSFVSSAEAFLSKYQGTFQISGNEDFNSQLTDTAKVDLEKKIELCKTALSAIEKKYP